MPAEITSPVRLSVEIDSQDLSADVGAITVDVHGGLVAMPDVRAALADLLTRVAASLDVDQSDFALAAPSQG
ncbi:hypothetical protein ACIRJR_09410 [Streptomyces sp. NPDC102402]|uniref:hypothetical protein n=1 Tax=Streptomyces sp. NPDC102402 TaxID=3366169 RepID=UPI0038240985